MTTLANMTAANLAIIHNRFAARPVTKFESKPVAISRTLAVLADRGISLDEALGRAPAAAPIVPAAKRAPITGPAGGPSPATLGARAAKADDAERAAEAKAAAWEGLPAKPAKKPTKATEAADRRAAEKIAKGAKMFQANKALMEEKAAKAAKPTRRPYGDKPTITDACILPNPPDFTANTHKPYRKKLDALTALVAARDIAGLEAFAINPTSTSPKALIRYRDRAISAIRFQNNEVA